MDHDCDEGRVNIFWVNYKKKQVSSDWGWCTVCYPEANDCFICPWLNAGDYDEISINEYYNYIKIGYKEVDNRRGW